jgi:hypothetical protein
MEAGIEPVGPCFGSAGKSGGAFQQIGPARVADKEKISTQ